MKKETEIGKNKKPGPMVTIADGSTVELEDVLTQYPSSTTLNISGLDIDDIDLNKIALPMLRALVIEDTSLTGIDLEPLSVCEWLIFLRINYNKNLKSIDLSPLGNYKSLVDLQIRDNLLNEIHFPQLRNCKKLYKLDITNNPFQDLRLDGINEIKNLRSLSIGPRNIRDPEVWTIDLSPLFSCQNLEELFLPDSYVRVLIDSRFRESYESAKWRIRHLDDIIEFY
ncbi:MAG: hypothetical protein ACXADL_13125 [Candidatus Thorarchaeota archaeon]|jgi:Leucine-rich repeat (LRR) protein